MKIEGVHDLTVDLVLSNAKAYVEMKIVDCSIAVDSGRIAKIGKETNMPEATTKLDLRKLLVLPGLIDAHVHLRNEGKAYKEDFYTGTSAAAAGGFTTVLDMPNNDPVTMGKEAVQNRMKKAQKETLVKVGFYSEFPEVNDEIREIATQGVVAFKLFMAEQVGGLDIDDDNALLESFKILGELNVPLAVHAEDKGSLKKMVDELRRTGRNNIGSYLEAHSENVEAKAINRMIKIGERTDIHLHFCHMTTKKGLELIMKGKKDGMPVTCEATPHNLLLTVKELKHIGTLALTMPPVREGRHVRALWDGVSTHLIDILASDHAPHALEEKNARSVWDVKTGVPGLETTLPLLLTEVRRRRLSIADLVRLMAEKPAEIFKLEGAGYLREESKADLTIVDLKKKHKIDASKFHSKAKYSPFDGWWVEGKAVKTFVNGRLIMDEGQIVANPGSGEIVRRK